MKEEVEDLRVKLNRKRAMRSVVVVENDLPINSPEDPVEEHPQSSRTRSHEYNSTYNFNGIMIKTIFISFCTRTRARSPKRQRNNKAKRDYYQAMVRLRPRILEQAA
jgi:hypothetical protein